MNNNPYNAISKKLHFSNITIKEIKRKNIHWLCFPYKVKKPRSQSDHWKDNGVEAPKALLFTGQFNYFTWNY